MDFKDGEITERLVDHSLGLRYDDLPADVVHRTKHLFLDFLAVAFGGKHLAESSAAIMEGVMDLAMGQSGPSTIVGQSNTTTAHFAALLNGTFAHSLDFDDTHREAIIHPGAPIFATLMAVAEKHCNSGRDVISGAVAAYDMAIKINKAIGEGIHKRGFHASATTGIFGATIGGARLMGLTREQALNAVGLNGSQAAGSQQFLEFGGWNKRLHVGLAAHNAIYALILAQHGFQGATRPLEGRYGYVFNFSADGWDVSKIDVPNGDFEIMKTGIKPYPCCRYNHGPIDAVMELTSENKLGLDAIASMDLYFSPLGHEVVGIPVALKRNPSTIVEGQFSAYFAAAAAAVDQGYTWDSYRKLQDPKVKALMEVTTAHPDPRLERFGSRVDITTRDGRIFSRHVPLATGEPERFPGWEDEVIKFKDMAEPILGVSGAGQVVESIADMENCDDFGLITRMLRI
ncbi:MmgE/PrpD family protein [SAR202 cluster bacterium AD-804-J14_MRT_500m]|nr:MmgE/PrpD family protein [SAR202 cluster bacterium AD-804-J14_MRT_500m]